MSTRMNQDMIRDSSNYIDVEAHKDQLDAETFRDALKHRQEFAQQGYIEEEDDDDVFLNNVQLPNFQTNDSPNLMNPKWAPILTKKQREIAKRAQAQFYPEESSSSSSSSSSSEDHYPEGGEPWESEYSYPYQPWGNDTDHLEANQDQACDPSIVSEEGEYVATFGSRGSKMLGTPPGSTSMWPSCETLVEACASAADVEDNFNEVPIGIINQMNTCYLNSFLQSMFHLPVFREAVFNIPLNPDTPTKDNWVLALQRLFYDLQTGKNAPSSRRLTRAFQWRDNESHLTQQDVSEFGNDLLTKLETFLPQDIIDLMTAKRRRIFVSESDNYTKHLDDEALYIYSAPGPPRKIFSLSSLMRNFSKYERDILPVDVDDPNHPKYGQKINATSQIIFSKLPAILFVCIDRLDYTVHGATKSNKFYEYPEVLNLKNLDSEVPEENRDGIQSVYNLKTVVVHAGKTTTSGHYFAYSQVGDIWYRIEDEKVDKTTSFESVHRNFGGQQQEQQPPKKQQATEKENDPNSSAFFLVYVKQGAEKIVFKEFTNEQIPLELRNLFKDEREQEKEQRLSIVKSLNSIEVHICTDEDLNVTNAIDLIPVDSPRFKVIQVPNGIKYKAFIEDLAKKYEREVLQFRVWPLMLRRNNSFRPFQLDWPSKPNNNLYTIADTDFNCWKILLEFSEQGMAFSHQQQSGEVCVFIKYFDIETLSVTFVGTMITKTSAPLTDLFSKCAREGMIKGLFTGIQPDGKPINSGSFLMFEEQSAYQLIDICGSSGDLNGTIEHAVNRLQTGDVIVFQLNPQRYSDRLYFDQAGIDDPFALAYTRADKTFESWSYVITLTCEEKNLKLQHDLEVNVEWSARHLRLLISRELNLEEDDIKLLIEGQDAGDQFGQGYVPIEYKPLNNPRQQNVYDMQLDEIYPTLVNPFYEVMKRGPAAGYHNVQWERPRVHKKIMFEAATLRDERALCREIYEIVIFDYNRFREVALLNFSLVENKRNLAPNENKLVFDILYEAGLLMSLWEATDFTADWNPATPKVAEKLRRVRLVEIANEKCHGVFRGSDMAANVLRQTLLLPERRMRIDIHVPAQQEEENVRLLDSQKLVGVAFYKGRPIDYHLFVDDDEWLPRARPHYIFVTERQSFGDIREEIIRSCKITKEQLDKKKVSFHFIDQGQRKQVEITADCKEKVAFANNANEEFFINSYTFIGVNWKERPLKPPKQTLLIPTA